MQAQQLSLFGGGPRGPWKVDTTFSGIRRIALDQEGEEGAWVEHLPSWLAGHEGVMDVLVRSTQWRSERRQMYDRVVDVPRLVAALPDDGPGHPVIDEIRGCLERRYGVAFPHVSLGFYRDGRDSVAWHGDYVARNMREALVATVSLGEPRRFLLRPARPSAGSTGQTPATRAFLLGWGDLLVMGGTCQRTWRHAVPKVAAAGPRLAIMFRPTWYAPR